MVNLKSDPHEQLCCSMPMEQYGYGLRIYLCEEDCEKLGITKALRAGTEVAISATESLERPEAGETKGNGINLSLQITDLGVNAAGVRRDAAAELYGKD